MPDPIEVPPPDPTAITAAPPPPPPPPPKRGVAWLAWVVIALVVGFELLWPHFRPTPKKDAGDEAARRVLADVQAREIVGMAEFVGQRSTFYAEAKKNLDTGPVPDRLRFIVVAGELEGPAEALKQLQQLEERAAKQGVVLSDEQRADVTALEHLYQARKEAPGGPPGAPLTEDDRERLRGDLGWCGELALTPPDDPDRAAREAVVGPAGRFARTYLAVNAGGLFLGMLGLVGLVAWHCRPPRATAASMRKPSPSTWPSSSASAWPAPSSPSTGPTCCWAGWRCSSASRRGSPGRCCAACRGDRCARRSA
jgi:hypothetical protein